MKTILAALLVCALLSGCATFGQVDAGLKGLRGKNIQTAFDVLGYPSGKQEFGNDTVYYWSVEESSTMLLPTTSTTSGRVGDTSFSGTTTSNQLVPINNSCLIKLVAGKNGVIKNYEWTGNIGGLGRYANRLKNYSKQYYIQNTLYASPSSLGVRKGMSEQEVKDVLGEKVEIQNTPFASFWLYPNKADLTFKRNNENEQYILDSWRQLR